MTRRFALPLLFLSAGAMAESVTGIYTSLESETYSEVASIKQTIDGLEGEPVKGGDFAFTHNQFELGYQQGAWSVNYFARYDQYWQFNSDTARLIYLDKNNVPITTQETFDVNLQVNGLQAQGLGFSYRLQENNIAARYRVNYFYATEVTDGGLRGQLETLASGYRGDLWLDYGYSEDLLLERQQESVSGHGLGFDLDLAWTLSDELTLRFSGRDVFARIRWSDLTYTQARATTDTISYTPGGTLESVPGVAGVEGYRTQTQQLPTRLTLGADYRVHNTTTLSWEVFRYDEHNFPRLKLAWQWRALSLQTSYDLAAEALGLALSSRYLTLAVGADSLDEDKAQALHVALSVRVPL